MKQKYFDISTILLPRANLEEILEWVFLPFLFLFFSPTPKV